MTTKPGETPDGPKVQSDRRSITDQDIPQILSDEGEAPRDSSPTGEPDELDHRSITDQDVPEILSDEGGAHSSPTGEPDKV